MFAYVFEDSRTGWNKVGISENPSKRFAQFVRAGANQGRVFASREMDGDRCRGIEKLALSRLRERFPIHGEWVECTFRFACETVENAVLVSDSILVEETGYPTLRLAQQRCVREYLDRVMADCGGRVAAAAVLAGRNRTEMYKLLKRYDVKL